MIKKHLMEILKLKNIRP